jgi:phage shock protein C
MSNEVKRIYRSRTDRMVSGVCGGLGAYLNLDSTVVRLLFVLLTLATGFAPGIVAYLILMIVIPEEPLTGAPPAPPASPEPPQS